MRSGHDPANPAALFVLMRGSDVAGCGQRAPGLHKHPSDVLCPTLCLPRGCDASPARSPAQGRPQFVTGVPHWEALAELVAVAPREKPSSPTEPAVMETWL